jgi:hypothetical protein
MKIFVALLPQNDSSVYTSQKTNNWYSSPVQKNSNTQNNSKTM